MKSIILLALIMTAFTSTQAATGTKETKGNVQAIPAANSKTDDKKATNDATAKYDDDSSQFVGTNDFYLLLVKEGVKKG
jgi:hypothetical protein